MEFVVGLPRCNEPEWVLKETIDAVARSSLKPSCVYIVDNGDVPLGMPVWLVDAPFSQVVVDVPGRNLGCAGGWNRLMTLAGGTKSIILNADCAVPPDAFERMRPSMEAASSIVCAFGFGCFHVPVSIYKRIGEFDEEFYPAYWEDTDYKRRAALAGVAIEHWPQVEASRPSFGRATYETGFTHGWDVTDGYQGWRAEKLAWFQERWRANRDRYTAKWGGEPGAETFTTPFGA